MHELLKFVPKPLANTTVCRIVIHRERADRTGKGEHDEQPEGFYFPSRLDGFDTLPAIKAALADAGFEATPAGDSGSAAETLI